MHGDAFGQFNQQKAARAAFSNFSGDREADAGGGNGRPSVRSSVAAASLPAAAASSSHLKLPARAAYPAPANAAAGSSSSSSSSSSARRASVTFSPASTKHTYIVSPSPNNAAQRGDDDDDDEDYLQSEQVRVWWQSVVCGSVYILPQFVAMMENMDANDYAAAFDANALPRLAGVIAGGNEEQAAVAWRVVRCGSNVGDFGGDNEVADVILAAAALALTSDRFVKCLSI